MYTNSVSSRVPLDISIDFTAQTQQQTSLICEISHVLQSHASLNAIADKLNTSLRKL